MRRVPGTYRLAPRGLVFNEDKTRIVHAEAEFDFLGFNVRRYPSGKLLIKPSKQAVRRVRNRLREEVRALRGAPPLAVLRALNPIVRGWSTYYRTVVSKEVFVSLDSYLWQLTTDGHCPGTRRSRSTGSLTGTSAASTKPGRTDGYSATETPAPTC